MGDVFGSSLPRLTRPVVRDRFRDHRGRRVRPRCPDCDKAISLKSVVCPGCDKVIQWVDPRSGQDQG